MKTFLTRLMHTYLNKLQEKYDTALSEINEYSQLLQALREGDFESSTDLFRKAMDDYHSNGNNTLRKIRFEKTSRMPLRSLTEHRECSPPSKA